MTIQDKTIGVIGYGNFGKVICHQLFPDNKIIVFTSSTTTSAFPRISFTQHFSEVAAKSDIIIPAVPTRAFAVVLDEIIPFLRPGSLILDVCSVKEYPVHILEKKVPNTVCAIASHPMFGPNSLLKKNNKIKNLKIVLHNISAPDTLFQSLCDYFARLGLILIHMDPTTHDTLAAKSQFFSLLVGEAAQQIRIKHTSIDTPAAEIIIDTLPYMGADRKIIEDMITYNRFCKPVLSQLVHLLQQLQTNE